MALSTLVIPSAKIPVPGNDDLVVRGLAPEDVVFLLRQQPDALEAVFTLLGDGVKTDLAASFGWALLSEVPTLGARIIACAADEPDQWEAARKLPITVQHAALEAVFALTFVGEGAAEKLLGTVIRLMQGTSGLLTQALPTLSRVSGRK